MNALFSHTRDYPTWRWFWVFVLLAIAARFIVGYTNDRFIHPDEMFQYYEPAHRLIYGYGYIPWEWVYGIRSWLLPLVVAFFMQLPVLFGYEGADYYEITVVLGFSVISATMVVAMYRFAQMITDETTARIALVLGTIWPIFLYYGPTPLPNLIAGVGLMWIAVLMMRLPTTANLIIIGVLSALTLGIRYQVIPAIGIMHLYMMYVLRGQYKWVLAGGVGMLIPIGMLDLVFWGGFFSSFIDNFYFNFTEKISEKFGREALCYYLQIYFIDTGGMIIPILFGVWYVFQKQTPIFLAISVGVMFMHIPAHKEFRFIVWMLPFALIGLAYLIAHYEHEKVSKRAIQGFLSFWVVAYSGIYLAFQYEVFEPLPHRKETISIVREIRNDPDLRGIHIDAGYAFWDRWGGYYYLNRPVPYYFRDVNGEWVELIDDDYDKSAVSHIVTDVDEPPTDDSELIMTTSTFWVWKRRNIPEPYDGPYNTVFIQRMLDIQAEAPGPRFPQISDRLPPDDRL